MILYSEGATKAQEDEAEGIIAVLTAAYPNHPWAVRVYDGGFFIRHLDFPANWGMNVKYKNFSHDAAVFKREIIMKAGEWLERAGLKRGRGNGDEIKWVEGVPINHQPAAAKAALKLIDEAAARAEAEKALAGSGHQKITLSNSVGEALRNAPTRETPRPQLLRGR